MRPSGRYPSPCVTQAAPRTEMARPPSGSAEPGREGPGGARPRPGHGEPGGTEAPGHAPQAPGPGPRVGRSEAAFGLTNATARLAGGRIGTARAAIVPDPPRLSSRDLPLARPGAPPSPAPRPLLPRDGRSPLPPREPRFPQPRRAATLHTLEAPRASRDCATPSARAAPSQHKGCSGRLVRGTPPRASLNDS